MTVNVIVKLEFHPLSEVLPLIEGQAYADLVASIKASGLHDTITLLDGMILDGRNRYRACLDAGIEPRTAVFEGDDPVAFVVAKNLHRRHLTVGQRALAVAKLATLSKGERQNLNSGIPAFKTVSEVAAMADVNKEAISDAHTIYARGTPDQVAEVENGAAISTVANKVRQEHGIKRKSPRRNGLSIAVPKGKTIAEVAREGIALERSGTVRADVAKKIGISEKAYKVMRDTILLLECDELERAERKVITAALHSIEETLQITPAQKLIEPIATRVWGKKGHRITRRKLPIKRRLEQFDNAISFLEHACENAVDIEIPQISAERANDAAQRLSNAETYLRELRVRIQRETVQ